jgi:hypothetical protein
MESTDATEFPFIKELPKGEAKKTLGVWDLIDSYAENFKTDGILLPVSIAAQALHVSRSRVHQFIQDGRLKARQINGLMLVTQTSLLECADIARKSGRPFKTGAIEATLKYAAEK